MPKSFIRRFSKASFIVTNIVVCIFFLLGCYTGYFNPRFWWWAGYFNLAAFYLMLIIIFFLICWLFIRPKWCLVSLITLLLAFKPIKNIIPFRFYSAFNKQKNSNTLRIMSWNVAQFNILNHKNQPYVKQQMLDLINEYDPDIACFQEMVCADTVVDTNTSYYHKYSFYSLDDFARQLNFTDHFYAYNKKEDFMNQQHFGIIIFSKYPIIKKEMVSTYPNNYNSIFQYTDIIVNQDDTFRVFNIHLQSLRFSAKNLQYIEKPEMKDGEDIQKSKNIFGKLKNGFLKRQMQADRIREEIDKSPYPVIVCGDFNDLPNSYAYTKIGNGMKNAFVEKGAGIGRTFSRISPTLRIDNIFINPTYRVEQFTTISKKLSDHYPIIADVTR